MSMFPPGGPPGRRWRRALLAALITLGLSGIGLINPVTAQDQEQDRDRDRDRICFEETGKCLAGPFLQYWQEHGGLPRFGYPISDELDEQNAPPPAGDGLRHRVQYTERARLELHEEVAGGGNQIMLGLLGREQLQERDRTRDQERDQDQERDRDRERDQDQDQVREQDRDRVCLTETGSCVGGAFLRYWQANGDVLRLGYPISGEFDELNPPPPLGDGQMHRVQYFERARLELHQDFADTEHEVMLGLLGRQLHQARYGGGQ